MRKYREISPNGRIGGAITDPPRPLLSLFSWQSTLRPDTDKEFDHFHEFSRNVSILGQVFPAMGIKGGEFMTAYQCTFREGKFMFVQPFPVIRDKSGSTLFMTSLEIKRYTVVH